MNNIMDIKTLRVKYKDQILEIAEKCNVENVRVFGSVARGKAKADSDIDFLVHLKPDIGFEFCDMKWKLEDLLNTKVDILSDNKINIRIKDQILNEAISL